MVLHIEKLPTIQCREANKGVDYMDYEYVYACPDSCGHFGAVGCFTRLVEF